MLRLLFDRDCLSVLIELNDAETFRIVYIVAEYGGAFAPFCVFYGGFQTFFQSVSCENIIAQYHGHTVVSDKVGADDKGLSQSVGTWLHRIGKADAELMAVSQESLKSGSILRS